MALSASSVFEIRTPGSDTNGGGFVTGQAGADFSQQNSANATNQGTTTLSAAITSTSATTCSVTAASSLYGSAQALLANPLVGDWIKIDSEIMKVTAVSTNTLTISRGQLGTSAATHSNGATVTNISNVSTTDLVTAGSTTITSATAYFSANVIGNLVYTAGGSGSITAGWYYISAVGTSGANTTATVDRSTGLTSGTGATINIGGALASPGQCAALCTVANMAVWQKSGTYSITSASTNIAGGCVSVTTAVVWQGYQSTRGDNGTRPLLQASGISTATIALINSANSFVANLSVDGANLTSILGFNTSTANVDNCTVQRCTNGGMAGGRFSRCYVTTTSGGNGAFAIGNGGSLNGCVAANNTVTGFYGNASTCMAFCLSYNNTGSTSVHGFLCGTNSSRWENCVAYGNAGSGFYCNYPDALINCIAEGNGVYGFNGQTTPVFLLNCTAYNNGTANTNGTLIEQGFIAYTSTGFVNASAGNFALNGNNGLYAASATVTNGGTGGTYAVNDLLTVVGGTGTAAVFKVLTVSSGHVATVAMVGAGSYTASPSNAASTSGGGGSGCTLTIIYASGAGLSLRAAGIPGTFPDGLTTGYLDVGVAQHQDSPATNIFVIDD